MLKQIFPCYIWSSNISNDLDLTSINNLVDSNQDWDLINTSNNRSISSSRTSEYGKLWDDIDISAYPVLVETFDVIKNSIKGYYKSLECNNDFSVASAWVHEYDENQAINWHNHRNAETVGVLYLKNFSSGGEVEFIDPKEYTLRNEPSGLRSNESFLHCPSDGDLMFFPGYLRHRSHKGTGANRRVLGFHFKTL